MAVAAQRISIDTLTGVKNKDSSQLIASKMETLNNQQQQALRPFDNRISETNDCDTDDTKSSSASSELAKGIKCSAISSMEREMPNFDYSYDVKRLRDLILKDHEENPGIYHQADIDKLKIDDWATARYLLRQKLDIDMAFDMMRRSLRFRNESIIHSIRDVDFPAEFYQIGGLFRYEPDRKGNLMLYMRVRLHRKTPEILSVIQAFFYYNLMRIDDEARGRGIALCFDCTGGGLASADMDMLSFIFSTFNNYFPKGLSYFLVHELPWILKPIWHLAKNWIPEDKRDLIKFSDSRTIFEYVDRENLPDFMGGTCKRPHNVPPENCTTLEQAIKLWGIERDIVKRTLMKFAQFLPAESLKALEDVDEMATNNSDDSDQENKP